MKINSQKKDLKVSKKERIMKIMNNIMKLMNNCRLIKYINIYEDIRTV